MKPSIATGILAALGLACATASAQGSFPNQPIRMIVPYSAGGVTDQVGRALAEQMGKRLGQSVVVENKTGANGTMGAIQMLQTKPDGYTITMVPIGIYRMPHITGAPYDPAKDFTYISQVAGYDYYLAVKGDAPWKTLDELVAYAKQNNNSISYGTPGAYSSQHIAMVQLGEAAQAQWTHIPFKGESDALSALMGGHIQTLVGASGILPYIKNGDVRALATLGEKRSAALPDVPTLKEAGYGVVHTSAFGIAGPKGMPADVVAKIDSAIGDALKDQAFADKLVQLGVSPLYLNHQDYTRAALQSVDTEKETIAKLGNISGK
ncbi:Bug family tripartite tricarboxylate transporter substrate binding protein [Bordetella petrii]|uniref:Bug family tripartite tricarboxylate transporter substrate binding protein n=1 Tax=Bordetella petrii TaxID=94624 RepID=UPI001E3EA771|nr:tripartite tricarboxylate transporter substrate binding protein [Bordetella petrii]MCD0504231.1 tripartite tricarboxylate transporter substrate binding protein [Bordetella petrii]